MCDYHMDENDIEEICKELFPGLTKPDKYDYIRFTPNLKQIFYAMAEQLHKIIVKDGTFFYNDSSTRVYFDIKVKKNCINLIQSLPTDVFDIHLTWYYSVVNVSVKIALFVPMLQRMVNLERNPNNEKLKKKTIEMLNAYQKIVNRCDK